MEESIRCLVLFLVFRIWVQLPWFTPTGPHHHLQTAI